MKNNTQKPRSPKVAQANPLPRRALLGALAAPLLPRPGRAQGTARVVVIGGGFGGATAARALAEDKRLDVTLIEANQTYTACPYSNEVIAGLRDIQSQRFTYTALTRAGIRTIFATATAIDPTARTIRAGDATIQYDRLILAPGIDLNFSALPGYDEPASQVMPHAWKAGAQTLNLRERLEQMEDGGTVLLSAPPNPYRCPPGPYERASLIAWYLKTKKPRSKLILLDSKDAFSKQKLFQQAWAKLYPNHLEWIGQSAGGTVTSAEPNNLTLQTEFGAHKGDVVCVIPPQRAGRIAALAGVADRTGWCPIDPNTFASRIVPNIHVIGDAAIAGAMPKSAFAANAQAKQCAEAVTAILFGRNPTEARLINTCYSLAAPGNGFSVAAVYKPVNGVLTEIEGAGGTSPLDAPDATTALEAQYGLAWFQTITGAVFG